MEHAIGTANIYTTGRGTAGAYFGNTGSRYRATNNEGILLLNLETTTVGNQSSQIPTNGMHTNVVLGRS